MQLDLYSHPCPHDSECQHHPDCWREAVGIHRNTRVPEALVFPGGGFRCDRCTCSLAVAASTHFQKLNVAEPYSYFTDFTSENAAKAAVRQVQRLGGDRVSLQFYGRPPIMFSSIFTQVRDHSPALRLPTPASAVLLNKRICDSTNAPFLLKVDYTYRGEAKERWVGYGQIRRIDWSTNWRPASEPRQPSVRIQAGISKPGKSRVKIRENTDYELGNPISEDVPLEQAAHEMGDAIYSRENHQTSHINGAWRTTKY